MFYDKSVRIAHCAHSSYDIIIIVFIYIYI